MDLIDKASSTMSLVTVRKVSLGLLGTAAILRAGGRDVERPEVAQCIEAICIFEPLLRFPPSSSACWQAPWSIDRIGPVFDLTFANERPQLLLGPTATNLGD